jgi:microcystin-dependent protein
MSSYSNYLRSKNICCSQGLRGPQGIVGPTGLVGPTGAPGPTGSIPSNGFVPSGAIMLFGTSVPPNGWLECDGSQVLISDYPDLFLAIGCTFGCVASPYFVLPDLRGYFVRGWSNTSTLDAGRVLGSTQTAQLEQHKHISSNNDCQDYSNVNGVGTGTYNSWCDTNEIGSGSSASLTDDGTFPEQTASVGDETRPINIALMYCIKT